MFVAVISAVSATTHGPHRRSASRAYDQLVPRPCIDAPSGDNRVMAVDFFQYSYGMNITDIEQFSQYDYANGENMGTSKETNIIWNQGASDSPSYIEAFNYKPLMKLSHFALVMTSFFIAESTGLYEFQFSNTQIVSMQLGMGEICGDPRKYSAINNNVFSGEGSLRVVTYLLKGYAYPIRILYANDGGSTTSLSVKVSDSSSSTFGNLPNSCDYRIPAEDTVIEYRDYNYLNKW